MKTISINSKSLEQDHGNFLIRWFNNQVIQFEQERFGRMVIFLTLQSCVGSVAAMLGLQSHVGDWALITSAVATMWSNSMFIAQASPKWTLIIFYLSLLVNTALIVTFA